MICRECPDELKEAICGLLFASSRCGDFPELQEIRAIFTSRYGKEFVARAIELRNNCGVNTKVILISNLSTLNTNRNSNEICYKVNLRLHRLYRNSQPNNQTCRADGMCSMRLLLSIALPYNSVKPLFPLPRYAIYDRNIQRD